MKDALLHFLALESKMLTIMSSMNDRVHFKVEDEAFKMRTR